MAQVRIKIETILDKQVTILDLFKYPTIATLAQYLSGCNEHEKISEAREKPKANDRSNKIAVIGLSGRFPRARNTDEFWKNLCDGVNSISHFTDEEVLEEGVEPDMLKKPGYVKAWGALEDIDMFDAKFFGYNPREAEVLDPQQRIFLEECWNAVENAGYNVEKYKGLVGVYASVAMNTYAPNLVNSEESKGLANDYQIMISNDKDFLATRIAYKLNLEGPSLTVQTACSSSLVAVHLACQSLINEECDMALAGGVSIRMPQKSGYLYQDGMILSPDGNCRAFDEQARGTVGGNGAGVVLLKRLDDAIADGDDIRAVILGSAINNDGAMKIGYTAPRIVGQEKVIAKAQEIAQINPDSVTYIEAHGTGTPLGDPIEIEALTQVFREKTQKNAFCAIGSVKTNVGHLDSAAGITGLIKTILSLKNRMIPPSLNFESPNKKINFADSPFYVNKTLNQWDNGSNPLRAGVSAFGIGGTNAHVILEEAPVCFTTSTYGKPLLITLSAKSKNALNNITKNLVSFLESNKEINLADIAYTLQLGRKEFEFRRFFICSTVEEALELLKNADSYPAMVFDSNEVKNHVTSQSLSEDIEKYTLEQIGQMWLSGVSIDWEQLYRGQKRKRLALPVYPFERSSFWVNKKAQKEHDINTKRPDVPDWFYTPVWRQSVESGSFDITIDSKRETLLILKDSNGFSNAMEARLKEENAKVIVVVSEKEYSSSGFEKFTINPENPAHYNQLISELFQRGTVPGRIVNMLGINETEVNINSTNLGERLLCSMMYIAQAIGSTGITTPIQLKVLTNNTHKIFNEPRLLPENALHLGACRVIPIEYPNIKCCSIDMVLPQAGSTEEQELLNLLSDDIYLMPCEGLVAYRGMERWRQEFECIKLQEKNKHSIKLKNDGVYVITGGLGGIGIEIAKYIAYEVQRVKLVLIAKSEFPEREQWDSWIQSNGKRNHISQKIVKLKELISLGADICIQQTDITDINQLRRTEELIINNFGKVDGIIHAAGKPGSGMIQLKKREQVQSVLAPKVQGTINLFDAFRDVNPDFMLLFSSLNAITGGFGQMDYSAANAFVDAFAQAHDKYRGMRVISIDWDRWPGIGMASGMLPGPDETIQSIHPLLGKCVFDKEDKVVYSSELCPENDWVLSEHRVLGVPTIAGTTYLEMARAAYEDITGNNRCEISEVLFLSPLTVKPGNTRETYTVLTKNEDTYNFKVISRSSLEDSDKSNWTEHIRGRIAATETKNDKTLEIEELKKKCCAKTLYSSGEIYSISESFISFGGRWRSLRRFSTGENTGLVEVELDKEFIQDLKSYKIHPALLDVATGAVRLVVGGNYLPFSYEKLEILKVLPSKIYGYICFKNNYSLSKDIITCDIDIVGENGELLINIKNFSMKLINQSSVENFKEVQYFGAGQESNTPIIELIEKLTSNEGGILKEGINVQEGLKAFEYIINGCFKPQIVVSPKDIDTAMKQANYATQPGIGKNLIKADVLKKRHQRPEMENDYVPPKNEIEKNLADIWEEVLSIDNLGIHDEFFALGGDSLLLIQLHTKIKERFTTDIAVVDLYKYNTIALLSKYLIGNKKEEAPAFTEVNSRASKQIELMKKRREQMQRGKGVTMNEQL